MNKQLVGLQFLLISFGLVYGQSPLNATRLYPPEILEPSPSQISDLELPQTGRGSPDSTAGAGSRLYLPSPGSATPDGLTGGVKRGSCLDQQAFRAILPNQDSEAIAKTAASEISLWFYIPKNGAVRAEFSVYSQDDDFESLIYYQEIDNISSRDGLLQITLPTNTVQPGQQFWWDLTLTCNLNDRGADTYSFGSIQRLDPATVQLENLPEVIAVVRSALMAKDSYLTVPDRLSLGNALLANDDVQTVQMVSDRLKEHYLGLWQRYEELNQSLDELLIYSYVEPDVTNALLEEQAQVALELAQLSAFFGLWGDTVNLLAIHQAEYPETWQLLLQTIDSDRP